MTSLMLEIQQLENPDPVLTSKIVTYLKSQGVFDQFRRECMADVDTKPAYQNLRQRVEGSVKTFLRKNPWKPEMNKNQLRDQLRQHIHSGGFLDMGVDRIVDQVVNPKIYSSFLPKVEEVVQLCLKLDDDDKPVFVAPPRVQEPPQPLRFKDRHNLAPRAKVPAPLTGPRMPIIPNIEALKPPEPLDDKDPFTEQPGTPELDESSDKNYTTDDNGAEDNVDDDDDDEEEEEESPPFEPHSGSDRLILGIRTDSSDDSNDNQVVMTVVDDNLEERIDEEDKLEKENIGVKEEDDDEEEESSSDEYVPKTPTINMESSDGTVIEFNSITEYRQYQTKFDEESFGNVEEEVVCSQWMDESSSHMKEERSSNEEDSVGSARKRKLHNNSFDDASNSSLDKGNTSDEGKANTSIDVSKKKLKREVGHESEIEKESTSDEEKSIRSNSSYRKLKLEDYQHGSETDKGITSDEEKTLRSNYFSDKEMQIEEDEHESEIEKNNTSDEEKSFRSLYFSKSKLKLKKDENGSETEKGNSSDDGKSNKSNDFRPDELELEDGEHLKETGSRGSFNEDSSCSNLDQPVGLVEKKIYQNVNNSKEKYKNSSSSSKDSERSHRRHHHGRNKSSSHHRRLKDKVDSEENKKTDGSISSHSSKDKHYDVNESSRDQHKNRDRKISESSSGHSKSKHRDKNRSVQNNDENSMDLVENDLRQKHHKDKLQHDKERKKHDSHNKSSERKKGHESSHKYEKDTKYSSNKNSHKSSSERHKSDKEQRPRESSDKHKKHDKKSDKDNKQEPKKKHREHCKTSKHNESRRSSDRDSNGPSGRGHTSSSSKSSSTKSNVKTSVDSGERTSSNSDNTVSDNVEVPNEDSSKFTATSTQRITSHYRIVKNSRVESGVISPDQNESSDNLQDDKSSDLCSNTSFKNTDQIISGSDQTDDSYRESSDESEAKRNIDETELGQIEGVHIIKINDNLVDVKVDSTKKNSLMECQESISDPHNEMLTQDFTESAGSNHDNSSEKENIDLTLDNTKSTGGNLSSPDLEENVVKFKKPKIAANIFEVKKIMLARRKMRHMEKKKMKLLTKTTVQLSTNICDKKLQEEFNGFSEALLDKKEKYDLMIQRLSSEIEKDEINFISSNLITSWIDVSPDLDSYIENTLKGKVHRKIRVRLPPISEEHYEYDPDLNAYILLDTTRELPLTRKEKVDGNLNSLESNFESKEIFYNSSSSETFNKSNSSSSYTSCKLSSLLKCDSETLKKPEDEFSDLPKTQTQNSTPTSIETTNKQDSEIKACEGSALARKPTAIFSLTYNSMYKEILKEKNEEPVKKKMPNTPQTVVKITNNKMSEQVVVKTVQQTSTQKCQVPRISKSEPKVNGQISKTNPKNKMPLISRIAKAKKNKALPTSVTKSSPANGNISPDYTIIIEDDIPVNMSTEAINAMIGIQAGNADQGNVKSASPLLKEQQVYQRQTRESKPAGLRQQRYDNTDLYKPRLQLTSRRGRVCTSVPVVSPESGEGVTIAETRRKRAAAPSTVVSTKRRR